jgi:hypothetical protein
MADSGRDNIRKAVDEQREAVFAWLETTGTTVAIVALAVFVVFFLYIGIVR